MKIDLAYPAAGANDLEVEAAVGSIVQLSQLTPGQAGVIVAVDSDSPGGRRLMDLGFLVGTPIAMVRRAPLGDPIQFQLRGCNLCLRRSEASRVRVRIE